MTAASAIRITEADFQSQLIDLAHYRNWTVAHFRPGRTADGGWRTPVAADGAGFVDLVLVRPPRVIFAELKSDTGRLSDDQRRWLTSLRACPGVEVAVWRPRDFDDLVKVLR